MVLRGVESKVGVNDVGIESLGDGWVSRRLKGFMVCWV